MIIIVINECTEKCQKYNTIAIFISLLSNNFRYSISIRVSYFPVSRCEIRIFPSISQTSKEKFSDILFNGVFDVSKSAMTNSSTNDYQLDVFFRKSLLQRKWIKILKGRKDSGSSSSTLKNRWYHNVYHKSRVIITTTSIVIFPIVWKLIVQKTTYK